MGLQACHLILYCSCLGQSRFHDGVVCNGLRQGDVQRRGFVVLRSGGGGGERIALYGLRLEVDQGGHQGRPLGLQLNKS